MYAKIINNKLILINKKIEFAFAFKIRFKLKVHYSTFVLHGNSSCFTLVDKK